MQTVLQASGFEHTVCGGIESGALAAVAKIDPVDIAHQLKRRVLADEFMQRAAERVGDVVLAVGKSAGAAEAVHDGAGGAVDAAGDLLAVDGTFALGEGIAALKNGDLQPGTHMGKLVGRKNAAGTGADDDNVILLHGDPPDKRK